ncbi:hypothetical protein SPRG_10256 [Saprolegnia parasitica CBS 223.65]|uniref:Glutathione S-transferase n=1 Tax=Saprolegnia parasitica (strain CBS 223.65) TaxID=695850 RepID=A0A067CD56_SAPPC|nr:hypothetical protein SPRG_10256 [Saprolegnia parasitica CBS 223.65]KDO24722.1 hypothetical protein SPRG_10256 [Saprolegnia parasitica CBS 223.65]|eukprot:XP_012204602.1 hypothetical protein SPRG_10256 [Saprolegnia parasitica CBS 223.65]
MDDAAKPTTEHEALVQAHSSPASDDDYSICTEEDLIQSYAKPGERVLFWGSGSPQAWRVLIALEEKKIEYRSVCVSFSSGVLKTPAFQQLNPRMRVPVFADGTSGVILYECAAILAYLEQFYPNPLLPNDPKLYAIAQTRLHESNEILSMVGEMVVYLRRAQANATKNIRPNPDVLQAKWHYLESELKLWELYLTGRNYLVANEPCLCDIVVFTNVAYAVRCGLQLDGLYPRLAMWYLRMCSRPSIEKTWPPHWKTTIGFSVLAKCHFCMCAGKCVCCCQAK